jgi:hypothetical protein
VGVLYSFLQADNDEKLQIIVDWLTSDDKMPFADFKPGRYPTYAELRSVLDTLENYDFEYRIGKDFWDVSITAPNGEGVLLCGPGFHGDEKVSSHIYWKSLPEFMLTVAQEVANICGNVIMMNDTDLDDLIFVFPKQSD